MTEDTYRKALESANSELDELLGQQEQIARRIAQLRQTVGSLSPLVVGSENAKAVGDATPYLDKSGLTDVVRDVLRASDKPLRPLQVKEGLERIGFDLTVYKNAMAAVHTVLKRLVENGEAKSTTAGGQTLYQWSSGRLQESKKGK